MPTGSGKRLLIGVDRKVSGAPSKTARLTQIGSDNQHSLVRSLNSSCDLRGYEAGIEALSLLRLLQIDPRAQVFGSMKPSKKAKKGRHRRRAGSTWAIYWSGRTTTTQPRSRSMPRMSKMSFAAFQVRTEQFLVVAKPVPTFTG